MKITAKYQEHDFVQKTWGLEFQQLVNFWLQKFAPLPFTAVPWLGMNEHVSCNSLAQEEDLRGEESLIELNWRDENVNETRNWKVK